MERDIKETNLFFYFYYVYKMLGEMLAAVAEVTCVGLSTSVSEVQNQFSFRGTVRSSPLDTSSCRRDSVKHKPKRLYLTQL